MTHRGQAPWLVLPSAMQREQPISLVRSLMQCIDRASSVSPLQTSGVVVVRQRNVHLQLRPLLCTAAKARV